VETSWKPIAAGVLAIIGGSLKVLVGLGAYLYLTRFSSFDVSPSTAGAIVAALLAVGVTAIVGGSYAVRRRRWGLALAGTICAIVPPLFTAGILSTVWVTISRSEFEKQNISRR